MTDEELPALSADGVDLALPNAARVYDYQLGGSHNFAVDREFGDRVIAAAPFAPALARANRRFLMRAVRWCVQQGLRQFLDLGSGIPTADHVHTVARRLAPESRVAYVDVEPVAVAHSQDLLAGLQGVTMTRADVRDPATVLSAPGVTGMVDFAAPVALLAVAVLPFVVERADEVLGAYRDALAPGSVVVITHTSADYDDPDLASRLRSIEVLYRDSANPVRLRDRAEIQALLEGLPLVEPGLVDVVSWRGEEPDPAPFGAYAAVARIL